MVFRFNIIFELSWAYSMLRLLGAPYAGERRAPGALKGDESPGPISPANEITISYLSNNYFMEGYYWCA
jgi:hypothetical protein